MEVSEKTNQTERTAHKFRLLIEAVKNEIAKNPLGSKCEELEHHIKTILTSSPQHYEDHNTNNNSNNTSTNVAGYPNICIKFSALVEQVLSLLKSGKMKDKENTSCLNTLINHVHTIIFNP
jgi:hypothetical protein